MLSLAPASNPNHGVEDLWNKLQEVVTIGQSLDVDKLDHADRDQLDQISRITCGYAHFLLEWGMSNERGEPMPGPTFDQFSTLIESHCANSMTALRWAVRVQGGESPDPVRFQ